MLCLTCSSVHPLEWVNCESNDPLCLIYGMRQKYCNRLASSPQICALAAGLNRAGLCWLALCRTLTCPIASTSATMHLPSARHSAYVHWCSAGCVIARLACRPAGAPFFSPAVLPLCTSRPPSSRLAAGTPLFSRSMRNCACIRSANSWHVER